MTAGEVLLDAVGVAGALAFGYALAAALCGMASAIRKKVKRWRAK